MIEVTARRDGRTLWTNIVMATYHNADPQREWAALVQSRYPDDQLWDQIPSRSQATTGQLVSTAIRIVESADACTITIEEI